MRIGNRQIGKGHPCYIIAEIGINHNGDLALALDMIEAAAKAGADAVKFQKRTPELCVPEAQQTVMRDTPWGRMSYLNYKQRIEFDESAYLEISDKARWHDVDFFASPWDIPSVDFLEEFDPPCYKVASASLTDNDLLDRLVAAGRPVIMSTGMSTDIEIHQATMPFFDSKIDLALLHCVSAYPAKVEDLNLSAMTALDWSFPYPVGYSGHETGLSTTVAAVAMGASIVERHFTSDRALWGTDQAASVEPQGFARLVRDIRSVEAAMGDGVIGVQDCELDNRRKLRGV